MRVLIGVLLMASGGFTAGMKFFFGMAAGALILAIAVGVLRQIPKIPRYWKETAPTSQKK